MNNISAEISMIGQKLKQVTNFKCMGATLCKDGTYSAEMAAMAKLNRVWQCNTISFTSKFKLYESLVNSILLHGSESWTLLADSEKKGSRLSKPSDQGNFSTSPTWNTRPTTGRGARSTSSWCTRPLPATAKRQKLAWFGHVTLHHSLSKTILQSTLEGG